MSLSVQVDSQIDRCIYVCMNGVVPLPLNIGHHRLLASFFSVSNILTHTILVKLVPYTHTHKRKFAVAIDLHWLQLPFSHGHNRWSHALMRITNDGSMPSRPIVRPGGSSQPFGKRDDMPMNPPQTNRFVFPRSFFLSLSLPGSFFFFSPSPYWLSSTKL